MALTIIFIAHWVGDFIFQTSNMAIKKSKSLRWLSLHVLTYTGIMLIPSIFLFPWLLALKYTLVNGVIHWVVDFFTSKAVAKYQSKPRVYFPLIGFDQLLHILSLLWTLEFLERL